MQVRTIPADGRDKSNSAKPAVAPAIFFQRCKELRSFEIRPEGRRDDKFRVADLPQEKVAHAHFAAGANEQVRVRHVAGPEMVRNDFFGDVSGIEPSTISMRLL